MQPDLSLHTTPYQDESAGAAPDSAAPAAGNSEIPGLTPPSDRGRSRRMIADVIVDLGYASRERMEFFVEEARTSGRSPETALLEEGLIDSHQLARAVAERYGLDHIDLAVYHVDMAAANLLTVSAARRYSGVPVGHVDDGTLLVAMADPANVIALDDIRMMTGRDCRIAVAAVDDVDALIARLNTLQTAVSEAIEEGEDEEGPDEELAVLRESADDAPVIKLVHSILGQAVGEGASDIHFEPSDSEMRVRFRVDGVMHEAANVPKKMVPGVISRLKIMASMDIAEKRVPQDGRVSLTVEGRTVDVRVTSLPTVHGESATLRILDKSAVLLDLDKLGIEGEARKRFEDAVRKPYGAVFATGPTGSGKSTTLYAALNDLNETEKNILTIEDPVEYQIPGISQIQVNNKTGLSFAAGLRSMLRADPDIIMVGEIRDAETARIAVESALTGHMVLSTLHTNNAPNAITRLSEMGIETFLTASSIDCVVAQRLARTLCPNCKKPRTIPAAALAEHGFPVDGGDLEVQDPGGCARCSQSGYRGRSGIFEVMLITDEIKELTLRQASGDEIGRVARDQGMRTLREDGLDKVRAGLTSIEEVMRVTS